MEGQSDKSYKTTQPVPNAPPPYQQHYSEQGPQPSSQPPYQPVYRQNYDPNYEQPDYQANSQPNYQPNYQANYPSVFQSNYQPAYQPVYQPSYPQRPPERQSNEVHEESRPEGDTNYPKEGESDFDCGKSEFGDRMNYKDRKWRDVWALALWLTAMLAMAYGLAQLYSERHKVTVSGKGTGLTIFIIAVLAVVGVTIGFLWMSAMKKCAAEIIKAMLYANLALWIIMTLIYFAIGLTWAGIISLIFAVLFAIYVYYVRSRIPLSVAMMRVGITIIDENNATIALQLVTAALQVLWILWWGAVAYAYASKHEKGGLVFAGLLVMLYWTLEVFSNISHTTICGVAAVWFFSKTKKNPTWTAFKYSITKGLGSICYGSLLVAIVQTARALVKNAQSQYRGNAFVLCILECLLACLESLIRFFNNYAYAQVAIYGTSFVQSSKRTWNLLTNKGLDAWINDDLTGFALSCGALVGALVAAFVGYILSTAFTSIHSDMRVGYLLAGFVIGYFLCATVMMVVRSAVIAVFVCWAEDPAAMAHNRPSEFQLISEQWTKLYGPRH